MASQIPNRPDRGIRYRSLNNFYLADPRRISSPERDLGLWWRVGAHGPSYRAAWVRETGELYAARLGMPKEQADVQILGQGSDEELQQALEGWADVCPLPDSMTWLRHRASSLAQPEAPHRTPRRPRDLAPATHRAQQANRTLTNTHPRTTTTSPNRAGGGRRHLRDFPGAPARRPAISTSSAGWDERGSAAG